MYNDLYTTGVVTSSAPGLGSLIWTIISAVIAVAGTVCIFVLFLNKKNEGKFKGFLGWLYDFLHFKKLVIEFALKATYIAFAIFLTLSSFATIGTSFVMFLVELILGNILLRIVYEGLILFIKICNNVSEINKKMK